MGIFRSNNPLDYDSIDGIIIDESAPSPNIKGKSVNTVLLLGQFERGSEDIATVGNTKAFFKEYGNNSSYLGNIALVNKRFGNLKIKRVVAADAVSASLDLIDGAAAVVATITAKYKGSYGSNLNILIAAGDTGLDLTISDSNEKSVILPEVYKNILSATIASDLQDSELVTVSAIDDTKAFIVTAEVPLLNGSDGTIVDTDYELSLAESKEEGIANFVFFDEYNPTRNLYLKTHAAETQERMVITGGPLAESVTTVEAAVALLRDTSGRIIYSYNWIQTLVGGLKVYTSPASWLASILSQTGPNIDPAYSENTKYLYGAIKVNQSLGRSDYKRLMAAGACSFEYDSDVGIKIKSGIVTQIANSSKLTIVRRRMADWLTNSIGTFLKLYQNGINSFEKRTAVKGAIFAFDKTYSEGAQKILPSDNEVRAGKALLVDTESLNDDLSEGQGKFFIKYKRRIYSSMRFIVLIAEIGETVVVTESEE